MEGASQPTALAKRGDRGEGRRGTYALHSAVQILQVAAKSGSCERPDEEKSACLISKCVREAQGQADVRR